MRLCYRGVMYSYNSNSTQSVETTETALFLGQTYRVRRPIYQPGQPTLNLVYRGVAYSTGTGSTKQQPRQPPRPSEFVTKLLAQLGLFS
jgi:D-alanyl-D-alanine carboxypeptidase